MHHALGQEESGSEDPVVEYLQMPQYPDNESDFGLMGEACRILA
jgi:hypothetical protein